MSMMLPAMIKEQLVTCFKYWHDGIQEAMTYQNDLYAYVRTYPSEDRLKAYSYACDITEQNLKSCITQSDGGYKVWVNLKSLGNRGDDGTETLKLFHAMS